MNDFAQTVQTLQPQLLRFAKAQLRNDAWAEDAVSETVLAALAKPQAFTGQSQLKTWLIGILKHKVIDQIRRHSREVSATTQDDDEDIDDLLFNNTGHWRVAPGEWGDPEAACGRRGPGNCGKERRQRPPQAAADYFAIKRDSTSAGAGRHCTGAPRSGPTPGSRDRRASAGGPGASRPPGA